MTTSDTLAVRSVSPQDPDDVVVEVAATAPADVTLAAARAAKAQRGWWAAPAPTRSAALGAAAAALRARSAQLADLIVREVGKPAAEAVGEVARSVAILEYYAQASYAALGQILPSAASGAMWTERRPHGVAAAVTPWNFPLAIPLWKAAPALAAGNAVLLKPSPAATACALLLAEILDGTLPPGVFQVLPGGGGTGAAVLGAADVVSFTGSAAVGRQIVVHAAGRGAPVQAEMGGQNAAIVLRDADPAVAAAQIAPAAMSFAGQKCTATRRVVVIGDARRVGEVTQALVAAVAELAPGDPRVPGVLVGPVISAAARGAVLDAGPTAAAAGGRVLSGGTAPDRPGWYVTPTLVDGVDPGHPLTTEETFGPLAVVQAAADVEQGLRLAEGSRYGLVTGVHGRDLGEILTVVRGVGTGMIKVNAPTTGVDFWAPFGGERDSSYGQREQGLAALDFYAGTRTVTLTAHP